MKLENLSLRRDAMFDRCPDCEAIGALRRSKARTTWEQVVKRSKFWNIYRCRECGWRGIRSNFSVKRISMKTVFFYLFLMFVTAYIVKFVIGRFLLK